MAYEPYDGRERNKRIKKAMTDMKQDTELLNDYLKEQVPEGFGAPMNDAGESNEPANISQEQADMMPQRMFAQLPQHLLRQPNAGHLLIGNFPVGPSMQFYTQPGDTRVRDGKRTEDKRKRCGKRCAICVKAGVSDEEAEKCNGKANQEACQHFARFGRVTKIPRRKR